MDLPRIFNISPYDVKVPERVVAARMGFKGVGRIPDEFKGIYEEVYEFALKISKPIVVVEDYDVSSEDEITIDGMKISGNLAHSQLGKSVKITAMLATLGEKLDDEISKFHTEGKEIESFTLDAIGSELAEFTIRFVDGILRDERKLKGSARISPGYVDLPLSLNSWFAKKMGKYASVKCDDESFVFEPRKTISAFIGWSN